MVKLKALIATVADRIDLLIEFTVRHPLGGEEEVYMFLPRLWEKF